MSFEGKSYIVTGGGDGIGRATALMLGEAGANVTIADLNESSAEETARMVKERGSDARSIRTDVSVEEQVKAMVDLAVASFGGLHGAANCAGRFAKLVRLVDMTREDWDKVIAVNLTGPFLCMKHQIPKMIASGGGAIVVVSSSVSTMAVPLIAEYAASKAAVSALVRSTAAEYGAEGIRVNELRPGGTETGMFKEQLKSTPEMGPRTAERSFLGRLAKPEEPAAAIRWLLSDEASYVTGVNMSVDGGFSLS